MIWYDLSKVRAALWRARLPKEIEEIEFAQCFSFIFSAMIISRFCSADLLSNAFALRLGNNRFESGKDIQGCIINVKSQTSQWN